MNPRLRFKKADGTDYPDWEEKCFNDVFDCFEYGLNASATKYDGKNKYIRITDIDEEARTYSYNDVVSPNCELEDKYLVKENDILFARTGASVGKTYLYQKSDGILYFAGFLIRGHVNSKFDSRFIFQSTLSEEFKIWIKVNSLRTGQPGINSQQYASYKLQIPCLEEQKKIADFLSDIDEVILASDQEVKKLQELKKGAMQKIFSQEIRFKKDDGTDYPDWEEICFGDILYECKEKTDDKEKYPLYSLTLEDGVIPKPERYEREFLVKNTENAYKIAPSNSFVYNPMNLRFGTLKVNHENFDVCVSGYYNIFKLKNEETIGFWENFLVSKDMLNYYFYIAKGSLLEKLRVHFSQFVKIKKNLPCLEEQQKIGYFLSDFDEAISLAKQELEKWKLLKKGLLQQMFT